MTLLDKRLPFVLQTPVAIYSQMNYIKKNTFKFYYKRSITVSPATAVRNLVPLYKCADARVNNFKLQIRICLSAVLNTAVSKNILSSFCFTMRTAYVTRECRFCITDGYSVFEFADNWLFCSEHTQTHLYNR